MSRYGNPAAMYKGNNQQLIHRRRNRSTNAAQLTQDCKATGDRPLDMRLHAEIRSESIYILRSCTAVDGMMVSGPILNGHLGS